MRRSLDGLGPLYELSAALATTATAEQVAARAMETLLAQLDADDAWVVEFDPRVDGFAVLDHVGAGAAVVDLLQAPTDPVAGEMLRTARGRWPVWLADRSAVETHLPALAAALPHVASAVVLPLRAPAQPDVLGAIGLIFDRPRPTGEDGQALLVAVGELAGQALHWQRLRRAESTARQSAATAIERALRVAELTSALVGTVGVADVLDVLAEHLRAAVQGQTFSLREVTSKNVSRTVRVDGPPRGYEEFSDVSLDVSSSLAEVVEIRCPVFVLSASDHAARWGEAGSRMHRAAGVEGLARLPLLVEGELVAILSIGYWTPQDFPIEERQFLTTVADLAAQALGRAARSERLRAESRRHRLLSAAQAAINRRLNPLDQLRALAGSVVPELADMSTVHVLTTPVPPGVAPPLPVFTDRVAAEFVDGVEPAPLQSGIPWYAGDPIVETIRIGRLLAHPIATLAVPEWSERTGTAETFRTGLNHVVLAPVLVDGLVVAVASFGMCHDRPLWDSEDLAIVEAIAGHAATALEHGLDYQHTRETALVLQQRMLGDPPVIDGLQIAVRYQPAGREEVGGDWYDAVEIGPGRVALAVGDVVGHDIHAAAAMGQLRAALRTLSLDEFFEPGAVLQNLGQVNDSLQAAAFATALFARLTRTADGWELTWAAAGHPAPLLVDPDGRAFVLDQAVGGVALVPGLDLPRPTARIGMQPGATLLLYTDGLVERRGADIGESIAAMAAHAASLVDRPLEELCDILLQGAAGHDDAALLAVRIDSGT